MVDDEIVIEIGSQNKIGEEFARELLKTDTEKAGDDFALIYWQTTTGAASAEEEQSRRTAQTVRETVSRAKKGAKSLHWLELSLLLPLTLATQISCACVKAGKERESECESKFSRQACVPHFIIADDEMRRRQRQRFCSTTAWQQLNKWTKFRIGNRRGEGKNLRNLRKLKELRKRQKLR